MKTFPSFSPLSLLPSFPSPSSLLLSLPPPFLPFYIPFSFYSFVNCVYGRRLLSWVGDQGQPCSEPWSFLGAVILRSAPCLVVSSFLGKHKKDEADCQWETRPAAQKPLADPPRGRSLHLCGPCCATSRSPDTQSEAEQPSPSSPAVLQTPGIELCRLRERRAAAAHRRARILLPEPSLFGCGSAVLVNGAHRLKLSSLLLQKQMSEKLQFIIFQ